MKNFIFYDAMHWHIIVLLFYSNLKRFISSYEFHKKIIAIKWYVPSFSMCILLKNTKTRTTYKTFSIECRTAKIALIN